MTVTTPAEIHRLIIAALGDRAKFLRRDAASRKFTGLHYATTRAQIRAEAALCEDLQQILGNISPEALASVMEKRT